jgi:TolB-like protein
MTSFTNFLNKLYTVFIFALFLLAGCATMKSTAAVGTSERGHFKIAVFPVENKSAVRAPLDEIRESMLRALKKQGFDILSNDVVEQSMARHRVRYTGGLDALVARALHDEAGADAVLITSLEMYNEILPPRMSLFSRLVATGAKPEVLWSDSVGLAGDDAPGLLGLGLINDPHVLREKAVGLMMKSLAGYLTGGKAGLENGRKSFGPKIQFRSAAVGANLLENAVGFVDRTSLSADDRKGFVRVPVALMSPSGAPVTVEYTVGGGSAEAGKEYELKEKSLTFAPGEMIKTVDIEVKFNPVDKDDKTIDITLKSVKNAVLGSDTVHTLTILNTVPKPTVTFVSASQQVRENSGRALITAELSAVSGKDVIVPFTVSGTAKSPGNYTITPSPVVIKAGTKSAAIEVHAVDNGINEDDKTVVVTMSVLGHAAQGKLTQSTVTIVDADPPPVAAFTQKESHGEDRESPARIEVRLSAVSGKTVTVEYGATGGTAAAGGDYAPGSGLLTFLPGEQAKTIELAIKNSGIYDGNKTVVLGLVRANNAALGNDATHTYTIVNTAFIPTAAFTASTQRLKRSAGTVHITVQLSARSGRDVKVPFSVSGTALQGKDYVITQSPVVIPAGSPSAVITLTLKEGPPVDADQTIDVKMEKPEGAFVGSPNHYRLVIAKDVHPTIAVLPFFNSSTKKDAGDILMLQFVKELGRMSEFSVLEPGIVREQFLKMRVIMYEGISSSDIDLITNNIYADLILTGKVFDYKDAEAWAKPKVNFSVMLISRSSKKIVWASDSVNSGDDALIVFNWGEVNTANAMVSEMVQVVLKSMLAW